LGPLDRFQDKDAFTNYLASMNPKDPETWNKIMDAVGPENEASAKDALAKVYSTGDQTAIDMLYDMLVHQKRANPLNETFVGKVMENNPDLAQKNDQQPHPTQPKAEVPPPPQQQFAGLYLPPCSSGLSTKVASTSAYPAYVGNDEGMRMCPKTRGAVNTWICRYHCLDGIVLDANKTACGEAIWRQNVMDKFSPEYQKADGEWGGGYIENRFVVEHDNGGHPTWLKPGQRHAPIHEDAWSHEKRLQEMRRTEGKERGYSETSGDPKGLYNFDQHDIAKGPKPNLSEKDKDPISKLAYNRKTQKTALNMMGNGMNDQSSLAGKECPTCHQKFGQEVMFCPRCKSQLTFVSKQQAQTETGGIPKDDLMPMASSEAPVRFANGVYQATRNGVSAYGLDAVEARGKLDRMNNLQDENEKILQLMDPTMGITPDQPITNQTVPNAPMPTPMNPRPDPTPTTDERPLPTPGQVADEVQGGHSHFKPHVHPGVLDQEIEQASAMMSEKEKSEMQNLAAKTGLHPDK
jgi:hypothetical protein